MSAEHLQEILNKLETQATAFKELSNVIRAHTGEITELKTNLNAMKEEHVSFREELKAVQKQMTDLSILGPSAFVQKVFDENSAHSSMKPVGEGTADLSPTAQSTPSPPKPANEPGTRPESEKGNTDEPRKPEDPTTTQGQQYEHCCRPQPAPCMRRPTLAPMEYNGKTPWINYSMHFDAVAETNAWDDRTKTLYLAASLRGAALEFYQALCHEDRRIFARASSALASRFGAEQQEAVSHIQLRTRTQKNGEGFTEYADDLQRLIRLKFTECSESARDQIAMEYFLDGIYDLDIQEMVRNLAPSSLREAVQTATRVEASHRATRAARRTIRAAVATTNAGHRQPNRRTEETMRRNQTTPIQPPGNANELP